jgi:hypothetical protein
MLPPAPRPFSRFTLLLAGLQAGMLAVLWMLAWMGSSAVWQRRSFWTSENLLATTFYGGVAVRDGFTASTASGLALYLLVYSTLGGLLAAAIGMRLPPAKLVLASIAAALGWYYFSFHYVWKAVSPLVPLLHAVRPNLVGHIIYGALVARFPNYLPRNASPPVSELQPTAAEPSETNRGGNGS